MAQIKDKVSFSDPCRVIMHPEKIALRSFIFFSDARGPAGCPADTSTCTIVDLKIVSTTCRSTDIFKGVYRAFIDGVVLMPK